GDGGDRRNADGKRRGGAGGRQRRLDHLGGDAGRRRPADGNGGGHRRGRQRRDGDPRADRRHGTAGGAVDHGVLGRQRDGGRPPHQQHDADAERHGRGGGQHGRALPGRRVDRHDGGRRRRQLEPARRHLSGGRHLPVHGEGDGRGGQPGA